MPATKHKSEFSPGFLLWWEAYPTDRRLGKAQSYEFWVEFKLEERTDELVEKIERLKQTLWRTMERKHIKTSLYYLKHLRHEDDLVPVTVETSVGGMVSEKGLRTMQAAENVLRELEADYGAKRLQEFYPGTGSNG
jgi:hypothetical protein